MKRNYTAPDATVLTLDLTDVILSSPYEYQGPEDDFIDYGAL